MRNPLYHNHAVLLRYGIREVVDLTQQLRELDPTFRCMGENIGDPVAKGWNVPAFIKEIVTELIRSEHSQVFGYTHSRGRIETRHWVVGYAQRFSPSSRLDYEHVVFANGLGGAISILYRMIAPGSRVLQPNPGYPAHISTERFYAGVESIGYRLDPQRRWQPDLEHLEYQVRHHPNVTAILLINPNNPTGSVYDADVLEAIVRLAERHQLMVISDEVYFRLVFNNSRYVQLTELAKNRVPLVVLRGVSKDVPWPGARCGWMEFHNSDRDEEYNRFFESIKKPLMLEVCATSLPQAAAPLIYDHPEYTRWLGQYCKELENNSNAIYSILSKTAGIRVHPIQGAFYITVLFDESVLQAHQSLPISNPVVSDFIRQRVSAPNLPLDKRFAYYLLASTGICVVPASDFDSPYPGFRVTTLERDPVRRDQTYQRLSSAITQYLASA